MNNFVKKFLSSLLAMVMLVSSFTVLSVGSVTVSGAEITAKSEGWHETAYTEWLPVTGAASYEAYVKKTTESEYTKLDDELIREYSTFVRADALGLAAGTYNMKIVAKDSSGAEVASWESGAITVDSYIRDGFAFSDGGSSSGAYNDDGTLKSNAKVFYITEETKNTITMDVVTNSKGSTTTCTGLGPIIVALQKGYETTPLDFRFIGQVSIPSGTEQKLNQLDVKRAASPITFEGVGNDAFALFGFNLVEANNFEVRNLGFKDMTTKDEDGVTIKDGSQRIWVHNCDFFYGGAGSDADQAKGDGSVDLKGTSTKITVSDNHYWDSGKVNLCGLGEKADYEITYSRNWFDHSDSRHPRVRTGSVHVYNNYYDGVAKYGAGACTGSSLFVEGNYFRNTNNPVLISGQGTDGNGSGTFSGEDGGIIKMYDNIMVGSKYTYIEGITKAEDGTKVYNNWADGYTVDTRDETLPSTLVTYQGGTSYNNFDTTRDLGVSASDVLAAKDVPAYVTANAGRINGGNFKFAFNDEVDDKDYAVNPELDSALSAYTYKTDTAYVSGKSATGIDGNTFYTERADAYAAKVATLPSETDNTGNNSSGGGSSSTTDLVLDGKNDVSVSTITSVVTGLGTDGAFSIYAASDKSVSISSSKGIQLGGAGNFANKTRLISVTMAEAGTIYVTSASTSSDTRVLNVADENGNILGTIDTGSSKGVDVPSAGTYYIYSTNKGINVSKVSVTYDSSKEPVDPDPVDPDETESESSSETTTEESSASESSSETTTEESTNTETSSETTTEDNSDVVYGDVDGNTRLEIKDASLLLDMILNDNAQVISGVTDVTDDGKVDSADVAAIIQKILDGNWKMPCEKDVTESTTENTTMPSTEESSTEATTEETTEATTAETTTEATSEAPVDGSYVHNFTSDGKDSVFYTIVGNLSTDKGSVTYNGLDLTQCLKMETSTSITFNAPKAGTLTLVFSMTEGKHNCKVDDTKYDSDANGVVTVELEAGSHTITKRDNSNLFYMVFTAK
ncbi:MAG: hypothetical protein Q4F63_05555 [Clostridia bacterium]|nr:hypothetical protein [Clostridia bacterium]